MPVITRSQINDKVIYVADVDAEFINRCNSGSRVKNTKKNHNRFNEIMNIVEDMDCCDATDEQEEENDKAVCELWRLSMLIMKSGTKKQKRFMESYAQDCDMVWKNGKWISIEYLDDSN